MTAREPVERLSQSGPGVADLGEEPATPTCIDCSGPLPRRCSIGLVCCDCYHLLSADLPRYDNYSQRGWLA